MDNCHIVSLDWLLDSQNAKKKAPEKKYTMIQGGQDTSPAPSRAAANVDKKRTGPSNADEEPPAKKLREEPAAEKKILNIPVDEGCKSGCESGYV